MEENQQLERSFPQRAGALATDLAGRFQKLEPRLRTRYTVVAGCILACVAGLLWYTTRTDWRTLYAGLEPDDARVMASELTTAGIPYDVSPDGTALRVPFDRLDKARLATTAKGGPKSGRMGFELFDKPNWVGSDFDEKVNYQRALEGELEHTINTLSAVESSRVHLVMPHDSLFTEQQRDAKASVLLKLRRRTLPDEEAESIRNLVASAVDDLRPENVVLADAEGHGDLGRRGASGDQASHEQALAAKLVETLEPVAGAGNVRASVNVEYDTSTADEVDETYDPNNVVTLSMQRVEQAAGGQPQASGVPGTASNAPNVQPPLYPSQLSQMQNSKQESGTYGASKKVRHTMQGVGKVRRITAAILINHRMVAVGKQVSWQARTPDEMRHIADLAQAAIGYDAARGDQVSVENLAFEGNVATPAPALGERLLRTASESQTLLKYGIILLSMLALLIFVVRPVLRSFALQTAPVGAHELGAGMEQEALASGSAAAALTAEQIAVEQQRLHAQSVFEQVAEHLKREPAQSSRLLQSWIHAE
jgi:flagellar M-ring protein FliF